MKTFGIFCSLKTCQCSKIKTSNCVILLNPELNCNRVILVTKEQTEAVSHIRSQGKWTKKMLCVKPNTFSSSAPSSNIYNKNPRLHFCQRLHTVLKIWKKNKSKIWYKILESFYFRTSFYVRSCSKYCYHGFHYDGQLFFIWTCE